MTLALHCDGPGCDTWARYGTAGYTQFVTLYDTDDDCLGHFCTLWCMTRWGAQRSEPTEVIQ